MPYEFYHSIQESGLPAPAVIYPSHGEQTTFLDFVEKPDDAALGVQDNSCGDNRAKQRTPPGFIETRDASPAKLSRRSLVTGRAKSVHETRVKLAPD